MYPGNHTESEILSVPRNLKTRPGAPETHLAYITHDEDELLKKHKPGTPHKGPHDIPNYDSWDWEGGSVAEGGGFSSDSGTSEQLDYGYNTSNIGGAGSTTDFWGGWTDDMEDYDVEEDIASGYGTGYLPPEPEDTFTPHYELYGANQTGVIPGETQYERTNITKQNWNQYKNLWNSLQKMDPNTLKFYGYAKGSLSIPNELMNLVAQGSLVSGYEAEMSNEDYITTWANLEDLTLQAQQGNKHAQEQLAATTLFPAGYHSFNEISGKPYIGPIPNQRSGPGPGGGGYGGGRGGGGGGGRGGGMGGGGPRFQGDFAGENPWGQSQIQRAWINQLRGYNRGGIVSLC